MELRYYQQLAINQFNDHYYKKKNNRGILSMCCGSGKTFTFYSIMRNCINYHNENLFMYVTSRRLLVKDIIANLIEWMYLSQQKIDIIYKVSDFNKTELEENLLNKHKDDHYKFKKWFEYYKKYNFINPDENDIINQLNNRLTNTNTKVIIITTYDSCDKFINSISKYNNDNTNQINPNLIVLDECHHLVSADRIKKANTILEMNEDKYFFPDKYLFMTATPLQIIKKDNNSTFMNDMIEYSMDNIEIYGEIFFEYSFYQAAYDKNITGFDIILLEHNNKINRSELAKEIKKLDKEEKEQLYFEIIGELFNKAINKYKLRRTIVYLSNITKVNIFKEILIKLNLDCYICHSSQSGYERNININNFSDKSEDNKILLSVDILNEGIDIPICDSILFAEERTSETVIVQNIGRALRKYPGKEIAHVIIPTFIYNINNDNKLAVFSSKFKNIRYICDILRDKPLEKICYKRIARIKRDDVNNEKDHNYDPDNSDDDNDIINDNDNIEDTYERDWTDIKENEVLKFKNLIIDDTTLIQTTDNIANITFDQFKIHIRKNKIFNLINLAKFIKVNNIPTNIPHIHFEYDTNWKCYGDLFIDNNIFNYQEAKNIIKLLNLSGIHRPDDWIKYYNDNMMFGLYNNINCGFIDELIKIPHWPKIYYLSEWSTFESDILAWEDFLGKKLNSNKTGNMNNSSNITNSDSNLSNLINTDHYKKIKSFEPLKQILFDNYQTDLTEVTNFLNNKFKINSILSKVEFKSNKNRKIENIYISIRVNLPNEPLAVINSFPIIIYKTYMKYDPILENKKLFINKVKNCTEFDRSKKIYFEDNNIKNCIDKLCKEIEDELN